MSLPVIVFCLVLAEFRELLDRLFSWCDLCLPANEQAFAESHRQRIQKFQMQIVQEMKRSNSARSQVGLGVLFLTFEPTQCVWDIYSRSNSPRLQK